MDLVFDSKDELRTRMSRLREKLRKSEEERKKLEKTCDVLIKAFREEERMYYKALNNKYKKFLEDCNIRKKRNDVILRSLNRVEERSKALFAKTERLKLLKDHYIPYIRQVQFFNKEASAKLKDIPSVSQSMKSVHWKSPKIADIQEFNSADLLEGVHSKISLLKENKDEIQSDTLLDVNFRQLLDKESNRSNFTERNVGSDVQAQGARDIFYLKNQDNAGFLLENSLKEVHLTESARTQDLKNLPKQTTDPIQTTGVHTKENFETIVKLPQLINKCTNLINEVHRKNDRKPSNDAPVIENLINVDFHKSSDSSYKQKDLEKVKILREKGELNHQESIDKLKMVLENYGDEENKNISNFTELKNDQFDTENQLSEKIVEKYKYEMSEKDVSVENMSSVVTSFKIDRQDLPNKLTSVVPTIHDQQSNYFNNGCDQKNNQTVSKDPITEETIYPKGLDGVDYENETYPESYYEQPVHSHSSLASNVILEEDEYEVDVDEQESSDDGIQKLLIEKKKSIGNDNISSNASKMHVAEVSESSLSFEENVLKSSNSNLIETDYKEADAEENVMLLSPAKMNNGILSLENNNNVVSKSEPLRAEGKHSLNLKHLLESDSESFQIEHGDPISTNEDSDFDFSVHQNSS